MFRGQREFDFGDSVQVKQVGPLTYWSDGYKFLRHEPKTGCIMVVHTSGVYEGCEVRYRADLVRHALARPISF